MTDKNNKVMYIFKNIEKNKIIIKHDTYFTYEFPSNFLENIYVGDILEIIN